MTKLIWTTESVNEKGYDFLQSVLANMGSEKFQPTVRFGTLGTGDSPNYQVKKDLGALIGVKIEVFQSRSEQHKPYTGKEVFNDDNLSEEFSYAEIKAMLPQR